MTKFTNLTIMLSQLIVSNTAQDIQLKPISIDNTEKLNCQQPNALNSEIIKSNNLAWTYSSTQKDYNEQRSHYFILNDNPIFTYYVDKLRNSVELEDAGAAINLSANNRDISGVYACIDTGTEKAYAIYNVQVYAKPVVSLTSSALVAGQSGKVTCNVDGAWPDASYSITINNQEIDASQIYASDSTNDKTLKDYTFEATFEIPADQRIAEVSCTVSQKQPENSNVEAFWNPVAISESFRIDFPPETPMISNFDQIRVGVPDEQNEMECSAVSSPTYTIEWKVQNLDARFYETSENILKIYNVTTETHSNVTVECIVSNKYGSNQIVQSLTVVESTSDYSIGGMGSNTVLVIGVVIAVIVLGLIGLLVTVSRKKTASRYETNETDKEAGPEGVDYEQNPEREALAPEERDTKKELLM